MIAGMDWNLWYKALKPAERQRYAKRAGTTTGYIENHLVVPRERRKVPRPPLMRKLADASRGAVKFVDVLGFFYGPEAPKKGR